jgi:hypothetical protein
MKQDTPLPSQRSVRICTGKNDSSGLKKLRKLLPI